MEINEMISLIMNIGFPAFSAIVLYRELSRTREAHKEEMGKVTEALNNNTIVLTRILERLGLKDENEH